MPFIVETPNGGSALDCAMGARQLAIQDIQASVAPTVSTMFFLAYFGIAFDVPVSAIEFPEDIHLFRPKILGNPTLDMQCGLVLDGKRMTVTGANISEIHHRGADSQAIGHRQGPGPFLVTDSFLEAAGENVMFGGQDPRVPNVVPGDAVYLRNTFSKRPSWNPADPTYAGIRWVLKAYVELKNCQRVVFRGNTVKGNRAGWPAWVVDAFNQDGTAPWSVVQDALFEYNASEDTIAFVQLWAGTANIRRVLFRQNLAKVVDPGPGGNAYLRGSVGYISTSAPYIAEDVAFEDNVIPGISGAGLTVGQFANMPRLTMNRNIWPQGPACEGFWNWYESPGSFVQITAPGYAADKNVMWGQTPAAVRYIDSEFRRFLGAPAAGLNPDGTLTPESPLRAYGVGLDFAGLAAAMAPPTSATPPGAPASVRVTSAHFQEA